MRSDPRGRLHGAAPLVGRAAPFTLLLGGVWLVFLVEPVVGRWGDRDQPSVLLGMLAAVAFAALYLSVLWVHGRLISSYRLDFSMPRAYALLGSMTVCASAMWWGLDQRGSGAVIYLAVAASLALPTSHAVVVVPLVSAWEYVVNLAMPAWTPDLYMPGLALAAGFVMWGVKQVIARNLELVQVRAENERLIVERERNRFSRDLHDILGHSLTVITVRTELARRLVDVDVDRAREELAELERLSREALADVRRAVQGYREISLAAELARARVGLAAAGIEHELPGSADEVPAHLRELFAWTIREGVTNVIRHSGAQRCWVRLHHDRVSVVDDGRGDTSGTTPGTGLSGLMERAAALGASLHFRNAEPQGFALEVKAG